MFDAGECPVDAAGSVEHVFLTHAHGDHSRCLLRHWQLRRMFRMTEASYYVPASSVDGFGKIVRAEAETIDELGRLVVARVQSVDGITRTLTCPVVNI